MPVLDDDKHQLEWNSGGTLLKKLFSSLVACSPFSFLWFCRVWVPPSQLSRPLQKHLPPLLYQIASALHVRLRSTSNLYSLVYTSSARPVPSLSFLLLPLRRLLLLRAGIPHPRRRVQAPLQSSRSSLVLLRPLLVCVSFFLRK